jgi:chromosomal replication initiator protein
MNYWTMPSLKARQKVMKERLNYAENIIKEVSKFYSINADQVKGKSRLRDIVKARFMSIYLIKEETDFTLNAIGRMFNRHHSTILHSINTINNTLTIKYETDVSEDLKDLKKIINNLSY